MTKHPILIAIFLSGLSALSCAEEHVLPGRFQNMDRDGDGRISREEWAGPGKRFEKIDSDADGFLSIVEIRALIAQSGMGKPAAAESATQTTGAGMNNLIETGMVRGPHRRAIAFPDTPKEDLRAAGMDTSGLEVVFPKGTTCYAIDHVFGEQWKGGADTLHSGADIPAPYDVPIIAMSDGVVIFKTDGTDSGRKSRGTQIILQHAPADTGLPFWTYTLYSHFNKMPDWEIGTSVKKGQILGPNGRSGVPGTKREPHLHLTILISDSPRFGIMNGVVVPEFGRFIDPPAIFRGKLPVDTADMQKLSGAERKVNIAVMYENGEVFPQGSKVVWPFHCFR